MALTKLKVVLAAGVTVLGLVAVSASGSGASAKQTVNWATVTQLTASGPTSYSALVAAAKAEGTLNVITLPTNWANYGTIMTDFTKTFGIKINSENPEGSSQDELNAIKADAGRSDDPDVLDVGQSFGIEAAADGELAPYKVQTWANIPTSQKDLNGDWYADYGGYVAIGCDTKTVKVCPTSFKQMLDARPGLQDRYQQQPDRGRCSLRRGVRRGPRQRRLVQQHQAWHRLLPKLATRATSWPPSPARRPSSSVRRTS